MSDLGLHMRIAGPLPNPWFLALTSHSDHNPYQSKDEPYEGHLQPWLPTQL